MLLVVESLQKIATVQMLSERLQDIGQNGGFHEKKY